MKSHPKIIPTMLEVFGHCYRVATLVTRVADELGVEPAVKDDLTRAALIHDFGKLFVDLDILNAPRRLNEAERKLVHLHSEYGELLFSELENSRILKLVREHHSSESDTDNIVSILIMCDKYDALTSRRSYRSSDFSHEEALSIIKDEGCSERLLIVLNRLQVKENLYGEAI